METAASERLRDGVPAASRVPDGFVVCCEAVHHVLSRNRDGDRPVSIEFVLETSDVMVTADGTVVMELVPGVASTSTVEANDGKWWGGGRVHFSPVFFVQSVDDYLSSGPETEGRIQRAHQVVDNVRVDGVRVPVTVCSDMQDACHE